MDNEKLKYIIKNSSNNIWVIIATTIIIFIIVSVILYMFPTQIVLENRGYNVDIPRLLLTSFVVSLIIFIVLWVLLQYICSKM